jgi:hypothetical protein
MKNVFEAEMLDNDANAETVKCYLKELLKALWREGEGFSSKRPFGNSCWEFDLYKALVAANLVEGELDEYDCLISVDSKAANKLIFQAIEAL